MHRALILFFFTGLLGGLKAAAQLRLPPPADSTKAFVHIRPLPENFYKQNLSFFCRQELRLQKLTTVPFTFRVGSKDYVDYLERKPNAVKPQ